MIAVIVTVSEATAVYSPFWQVLDMLRDSRTCHQQQATTPLRTIAIITIVITVMTTLTKLIY